MATTTILGKEITAFSASYASYATEVSTSAATQTNHRVALLGASGGTEGTVYYDHNGITYDATTNKLIVSGQISATFYTGSLLGTASIATIATSASTVLTTTNATHYVTFVPDNNSGTPTAEAFGTVGNLTYNPSIGSLNATSITGSLRGTASYATVASQSGYTIQMVLATTGSNLAASTTYRMGAPVRNQLLTTGGINRIYVPRPGKVRYVNVFVRTNGTLASAGTSTFQLNNKMQRLK